ncbi:MAG TPA: aminoacyl-tRNA hydrolase, partial [Tepidisphaeraceae bacterium]|nr:aminoacyl-tRNA hydrolase [Tepidisphaeraceae bacterium]
QRLGWVRQPEQFGLLAKSKFDGLMLDGNLTLASGATEKMLLLKPMTYMNLSGRSVQAAMAFYQVAPSDTMVVLDDLALPCGKLRIRPGGSSGGHNGLKDIERALSTSQYPRLRIGLDAPPPRIPGKDYVLGRPNEEQRQRMGPAIDRAANALIVWAEKGIEAAMNQFNAAADGEENNRQESKGKR